MVGTRKIVRWLSGIVAALAIAVPVFMFACSPAWMPFGRAKPTCQEADDRTLYLKAIEKARQRARAPLRSPSDNSRQANVEKRLLSFNSAVEFLNSNPDCCSKTYDIGPGFRDLVDRSFFALYVLRAPDIRKEDVVIVNVTVFVNEDINGKARRYGMDYHVLLGRCGNTLNIGKFDMSATGPFENK